MQIPPDNTPESVREAMRLADEYAMMYDHHQQIEEGPDQTRTARENLEKFLHTLATKKENP